MPFTLSHPAAVLPFRRFLGGRMPFFALVFGSISPDLGYFFAFDTYFSDNSHTFYRSFTFCLPMGLVLFFIFSMLSRGFFLLLPESLAVVGRSLNVSDAWKPSRFFYTVLAVLIGSWTHIFWDSWTHQDGFFVEQFSFLHWQVVDRLPIYRFFQHCSTLLGAIVLWHFFRSECRRRRVDLKWTYSHLWCFWLGSFIFTLLFTYFTLTSDWNYWLAFNDRRLPFLFMVSLVRNFGIIVVLSAAWLEIRIR